MEALVTFYDIKSDTMLAYKNSAVVMLALITEVSMGKFSASFFKWLWAWILSGLANLWAFKFLKNLTTLLMRCCLCYWGKYWSKTSIETFGFTQTIIVNMAIELPVKTFLQDLTRKGPFYIPTRSWDLVGFCRNFVQDSCKIPQDPEGSCKILQDLAGMQEKDPFLVRSCKSIFTGLY